MFKQLRTKLTIVYCLLFATVISVISFAGFLYIQANTEQTINRELVNSVGVFEKLWDLRRAGLRDSLEVVSKDFGFREAVATEDIPTIQSSLANLQQRLELEIVFVVTRAGEVISYDETGALDTDGKIYAHLQSNDTSTGAFSLNGSVYQAVSAPILAPTKMGWLVLADEQDREQLQAVEDLTPVPVSATLVLGASEQQQTLTKSDAYLSIIKPIENFFGELGPHISITFPVELALEPYESLLFAIATFSALGMIVIVFATWRLSSDLTKPISRLDRAVRAFATGEKVAVDVRSNDEVSRLAGNFNLMVEEITDRESEIIRLSEEDSETQLPNRRAIEGQLDQLESLDKTLAITLRIKRFGHIRNAIGHRLAAQLLVELRQRIEDIFDDVVVARTGASDVSFLLPLRDLEEQTAELAVVVTDCARPVQFEDGDVDLLLCCGVALGIQSHVLPISLVDQAIVAADQAEREHRQISVFNIDDYGQPSETLSLMSEMITGLRDRDLFLALQPKLCLRTGAVTSFEALIRWKHPERGFIFPDQFIPMAEETGYIKQLTEWVVSEALVQQSSLREHGYDLPIAVNVSGRQLTDKSFIHWAISACKKAKGSLYFEVTETAIIADMTIASELMVLLKKNGIRISIDDYGTGQSSLSYLQQIPADELKIDRCFVMNLVKSEQDKLLIKSTVEIAHAMGMAVVAEGVEDAETLEILKNYHVDTAQGYHIMRPAALPEALEFLKKHNQESLIGALS